MYGMPSRMGPGSKMLPSNLYAAEHNLPGQNRHHHVSCRYGMPSRMGPGAGMPSKGSAHRAIVKGLPISASWQDLKVGYRLDLFWEHARASKFQEGSAHHAIVKWLPTSAFWQDPGMGSPSRVSVVFSTFSVHRNFQEGSAHRAIVQWLPIPASWQDLEAGSAIRASISSASNTSKGFAICASSRGCLPPPPGRT